MPKPDDYSHDEGGTDSDKERSQDFTNGHSPDRRSGRDRRKGFDRRSGLGRRRDLERRDSLRRDEK